MYFFIKNTFILIKYLNVKYFYSKLFKSWSKTCAAILLYCGQIWKLNYVEHTTKKNNNSKDLKTFNTRSNIIAHKKKLASIAECTQIHYSVVIISLEFNTSINTEKLNKVWIPKYSTIEGIQDIFKESKNA